MANEALDLNIEKIKKYSEYKLSEIGLKRFEEQYKIYRKKITKCFMIYLTPLPLVMYSFYKTFVEHSSFSTILLLSIAIEVMLVIFFCRKVDRVNENLKACLCIDYISTEMECYIKNLVVENGTVKDKKNGTTCSNKEKDIIEMFFVANQGIEILYVKQKFDKITNRKNNYLQ